MPIITINAECPFSIGDRVFCAPAGSSGKCAMHRITDILTIHRRKNNTVAFMYELDGNGKYVKIENGVHMSKREEN